MTKEDSNLEFRLNKKQMKKDITFSQKQNIMN